MAAFKRFWVYVAAALFYTAVFFWYTYPLIQHWNTQVVGWDNAFADTPQIFSNFYLFEKSMEAGTLFFSDQLFYPQGTSTALHGMIWGMDFIYWLSSAEAIPFLNTFLLMSCLLSGLGAFRLARNYTDNFLLALFTGFAFAYSSFRLAQYQDHYWYLVNFTIPWYLLYFPRVFDFHVRHGLFRIRSVKALLICLLLGVVSTSLDYYTTFFLIYLSFMYACYRRWGHLIRFRWRSTRHLIYLLAGILLVSGLVDLLKKAGLDDHHGFYWTGDLAGLLVPQNSRLHQLWVPASWTRGWTFPSGVEKNLFLGYGFLVALLWAVRISLHKQADRSARSLLLAGTIILVLCLPVLKVFGHSLIKLPSALLHYIPFLNNVRVPTRWGMLLFLFLPLYVSRVYSLRFVRVQANWIAGILLLLTLVEYRPSEYLRFPETDYNKTAERIKKEEGEVLLTLPLGVRDGFTQIGEVDTRFQYLQALHGKKMCGGYLSRVDKSLFDYYLQFPLCRDLFALEEGRLPGEQPGAGPSFLLTVRPDLLYVRSDMEDHPVFSRLKEYCVAEGIGLIALDKGLFRFYYP